MEFSLDQLPLDAIRQAACADAHAAITRLLQRSDADQLHGFAICTDPDVTSVYWTSETWKQLEERAESLFRKNREYEPDSELTIEFALKICRFEPADWPITQDQEPEINLNSLNEALSSVWEVVDELPDTDEMILEYCPAASKAALRAMGDGVRTFINSFDWSAWPNSHRPTLLVWENDPDFPDVVHEIAEQLNDAETFALFSETYGY